MADKPNATSNPVVAQTTVKLPPLDAVEREGQMALQDMVRAAATAFARTGHMDDNALERLGPAGRSLLLRALLKQSQRQAAAVIAAQKSVSKKGQTHARPSAKVSAVKAAAVGAGRAAVSLDHRAGWAAQRRPLEHHGMRAFASGTLAAVILTAVAILASANFIS
jgi:hypothetical protein